MRPPNRREHGKHGVPVYRILILFAVAYLMVQVGVIAWNGFTRTDGRTPTAKSAGRLWNYLADLTGNAGNTPRVAIIIDDFGQQQTPADLFTSLDAPLTFAILPKLPHSKQIAVQAVENGYEVMLHLPMEPHDVEASNPGASAIWTDMPASEVRRRIADAVDSIPGLVGVNNHMGSKATEDRETMRVLMEELRRRGLYFIDSLTSRNSVAYDVAKMHHIPTARNRVFLDNSKDPADIGERVRQLGEIARRRGVAIGIGHAYPVTAHTLRDGLRMLREQGIQLVFASQVVR